MDHGFNHAGLDRIVAVAHTGNLASRHIMEKLGMTYEKTEGPLRCRVCLLRDLEGGIFEWRRS
jgi:RimJ/RimL family protein N-acetyltransferase